MTRRKKECKIHGMNPNEALKLAEIAVGSAAGLTAIYFGVRTILKHIHTKQEIRKGNLPDPHALTKWLNFMEGQPGVTIRKFRFPK